MRSQYTMITGLGLKLRIYTRSTLVHYWQERCYVCYAKTCHKMKAIQDHIHIHNTCTSRPSKYNSTTSGKVFKNSACRDGIPQKATKQAGTTSQYLRTIPPIPCVIFQLQATPLMSRISFDDYTLAIRV